MKKGTFEKLKKSFEEAVAIESSERAPARVMIREAPEFDPRIYGELPLDVLPRPIETEAENDRALSVVDRLMSKGEDNPTPEETTLLELLVDRTLRGEELSDPRCAGV
jgi:hypothetical protein